MLVCLLGHNKSGLGQPQPTTHCAQSTVDWHTHTVTHYHIHRHIPQASKSLLALKSNAFPLYTRFQISKFDFKFSMAITVYAVPQQQISLAICGQKLPFASCPKCQQIELCWARIPCPSPSLALLPHLCPSGNSFLLSFCWTLLLCTFLMLLTACQSTASRPTGLTRGVGGLEGWGRGRVATCEQVKTFWRLYKKK